jgi:hypothetical protein
VQVQLRTIVGSGYDSLRGGTVELSAICSIPYVLTEEQARTRLPTVRPAAMEGTEPV